MKRTEPTIHYLAGYIDGEGCITYASTLKLSCSNTYLPMLRVMKARWGGSVARKTGGDEAHRDAFQYEVTGEKAVAAIKELVANGLYEKRAQALIALAMRDLSPCDRVSLAEELSRLKRLTHTLPKNP